MKILSFLLVLMMLCISCGKSKEELSQIKQFEKHQKYFLQELTILTSKYKKCKDVKEFSKLDTRGMRIFSKMLVVSQKYYLFLKKFGLNKELQKTDDIILKKAIIVDRLNKKLALKFRKNPDKEILKTIKKNSLKSQKII